VIQGLVFEYTPFDLDTAIPTTLERMNEAFAGLGAGTVAAHKVFNNGLPVTVGFEVTAGTYPILNVAAGTLVTGLGVSYNFPAGTLTPDDPDAAEVFYIFVNADYELDVALTVPLDAVIVIAKATVNGGATAFSEISHEVQIESTTLNANGDPDVVELKTGPLVIRTTTWAYDAESRPETATEVTAVRTTISTYSYDPDQISTKSGFLFNGDWYFDGSHFLE
jgi:hypothetical protein